MTPQAQRIAIAEACGWKCSKLGWWSHPTLPDNGGSMHDCPDYLNDLNAMAEAEILVRNIERWGRYAELLAEIVIRDYDAGLSNWASTISATAAKRAEAFLRTLNLWDDSK